MLIIPEKLQLSSPLVGSLDYSRGNRSLRSSLTFYQENER